MVKRGGRHTELLGSYDTSIPCDRVLFAAMFEHKHMHTHLMVPARLASKALKVAVALRMKSVSARNSVSCSAPLRQGSNRVSTTRSAGVSSLYPVGRCRLVVRQSHNGGGRKVREGLQHPAQAECTWPLQRPCTPPPTPSMLLQQQRPATCPGDAAIAPACCSAFDTSSKDRLPVQSLSKNSKLQWQLHNEDYVCLTL